MNRRLFILSTAAAASVPGIPQLATKPPLKRVVTLVYDKALGAMRAIDKIVP